MKITLHIDQNEKFYDTSDLLSNVLEAMADVGCRPVFYEVNLGGEYLTVFPSCVVLGDCDLSFTRLATLPQGLEVGGALDLSNTDIDDVPDSLMVGGNLDLAQTAVDCLPEGFAVGGALNLSGTEITELPEGLFVGGDLYLSSPLPIPADARIDGNIYVNGVQQ